MGRSSWPSGTEVDKMKVIVSEMSGRDAAEVRVVVSPYRICPLGAHVDHQGGTVSAMTINKGILLAFVVSHGSEVFIRSEQFQGELKFRIDEQQFPTTDKGTRLNNTPLANQEPEWGRYARGALYALQHSGYHLNQGIVGFISGSEGLDSSGLSSSAAVGIAYLLALQSANNLVISQDVNIELDRIIENEYLGLRNGILDQSAILLSTYGCLTCMNCKTKEYSVIQPSRSQEHQPHHGQAYKILLAFSGLKQPLTKNLGYNSRVAECREAARILLDASQKLKMESVLCNVDPLEYEAHKSKLDINLKKRAEHYFSENLRVKEGLKAWTSGRLDDFGRLITASGLSSIKNYECGCEPLIQLYEVLLKAPGVLGARFSGAGFRGCCLAFVRANFAEEAAEFVKTEYRKLQPELAGQLTEDMAVLVCEPGDSAHIIK